MSESEHNGALERELFALARSESPRSDARQRMLVALGVGALGATVSSAGAAGAAASTANSALPAPHLAAGAKAAAVAGATGHAAPTVAALAIAKWVSAGALLGTLTVGGALSVARLSSDEGRSHDVAASRPLHPQTSSPQAAIAGQAAPRAASEPGRADPEAAVPSANGDDVVPMVPSSKMNADAARVAGPSVTGTRPDPARERAEANGMSLGARVPAEVKGFDPGAASLADEVSRIDRARSALASGDGVRALGELDDYDREFPEGRLRLEATVVRIEAMVRSGDLERARVLGRQFLAAHPTGGLAVRVHELIAR